MSTIVKREQVVDISGTLNSVTITVHSVGGAIREIKFKIDGPDIPFTVFNLPHANDLNSLTDFQSLIGEVLQFARQEGLK